MASVVKVCQLILEQFLIPKSIYQPIIIMNTQSSLTDKNHSSLFSKSFCAWILVFLTTLLSLSCTKENILIEPDIEEIPNKPVAYEGVDEELWDYFDRFELEASARGKIVDLRATMVSGTISEIANKNVAGRCNYNQRNPNKVTIDLSFWKRAGDRSREFVVFHELGHCVLFRGHKEDATVGNICKSIMRSGTGNCNDNYTRITRTSYLDELFDPSFEGDLFFASH